MSYSHTRAREAEVRARFIKDTAEHVLTIRNDDGLHRHLVVNVPGTSMYWFEVVTWPGSLAIHGDMGTHVFSRVADMFGFFRTFAEGSVNLHYWTEKLQATSGAQSFEPALLRALVLEEIQERTEDIIRDRAERRDALVEAANSEILYDDDLDENEAHRRLQSFNHDGFEFYDTGEWDLKAYDTHYIWCLFAIVHAINAYDEHHIETLGDILRTLSPTELIAEITAEQIDTTARCLWRGGWSAAQVTEAAVDGRLLTLAYQLGGIPALAPAWTLSTWRVATARTYARIRRALLIRPTTRWTEEKTRG